MRRRRLLLLFVVTALCLALGSSIASVAQAADKLPDLDQSAPSNLTVQQVSGRWRLGFDSQTVNRGPGAFRLQGRRPSTLISQMVVTQLVDQLNCFCRATYPTTAVMKYVSGGGHSHWHVLAFERYELRRTNGQTVLRDAKTGFCLSNLSPSNCDQNNPSALSVVMGLNSGAGDTYRAYLEGQYLDITGLAKGVYLLVHTSDPDRKFREVSRFNNYAALRIQLSYSGSVPSVRVLATCPGTATC